MKCLRIIVLAIAFGVGFVPGSGWSQDRSQFLGNPALIQLNERLFCKHVLHGDLFARTELFFGLSKPDGSVVSPAQFDAFVDGKITPRFPDGLTVIEAKGQFSAEGVTQKEDSRVVILLYEFSQKRSALIEEIRRLYREEFQQQSVLRVDEASCVSF